MKFPKPFLSSIHKLQNANCMYFFSVSLNVNDLIIKTNAQMIQNSFHKKWRFATISFKGKGRLYDAFDFKEMNIFDTLNENTNQMHK